MNPDVKKEVTHEAFSNKYEGVQQELTHVNERLGSLSEAALIAEMDWLSEQKESLIDLKSQIEELTSRKTKLESDLKELKFNSDILGIFTPKVPSSSIRTRLLMIYQSIDDIEFVDSPDLRQKLKELGISSDVKIKNNDISFEQQMKLNLIKRAISFCHAAHITLKNHFKVTDDASEANPIIDGVMNLILKEAQEFIQLILSQKNLDNSKDLENFRNKQLYPFISGIAQKIAVNIGADIKKVKDDLIIAERLANWERRSSSAFATASKKDGISTVQIETPIYQLTTAQLQELENMTEKEWFKALKPIEQYWLEQNREKIKRGELVSPPATIRNVPFIANFTKHTTIIMSADYKQGKVKSESLRLSTLSAIGVKNKAERQRLARLNAEQLLQVSDTQGRFRAFWSAEFLGKFNEHKPVHLFQSLLTPLGIQDAVSKYDNKNARMYQEAVEALKELKVDDIELLTDNWAINSERKLINSFNDANYQVKEKLRIHAVFLVTDIFKFIDGKKIEDKAYDGFIKSIMKDKSGKLDIFSIFYDSKKLREFAALMGNFSHVWAKNIFKEPFVEENTHGFCMALHALADLDDLWHQKAQIKNNVNRELWAAALEDIIVEGIGGTKSGGCKSAKDRKGTELVQVDAMKEFYIRYHQLPYCVTRQTEKSAEEMKIEMLLEPKKKAAEQNGTKGLKAFYEANKEILERLEKLKQLREAKEKTTSEKDREKFSEAYGDLYLAGLNQMVASDNAYGCYACLDGKSKFSPPKLAPMIPRDIQAVIGEDKIKCFNILGKTNKPEITIGKLADIDPIKITYPSEAAIAEAAEAKKTHAENLAVLQNSVLRDLLRNPAKTGYLKKDVLPELAKINQTILEADKSDEAELKTIKTHLIAAGIFLSEKEIKLVQQENIRMRTIEQQKHALDQQINAGYIKSSAVFANNMDPAEHLMIVKTIRLWVEQQMLDNPEIQQLDGVTSEHLIRFMINTYLTLINERKYEEKYSDNEEKYPELSLNDNSSMLSSVVESLPYQAAMRAWFSRRQKIGNEDEALLMQPLKEPVLIEQAKNDKSKIVIASKPRVNMYNAQIFRPRQLSGGVSVFLIAQPNQEQANKLVGDKTETAALSNFFNQIMKSNGKQPIEDKSVHMIAYGTHVSRVYVDLSAYLTYPVSDFFNYFDRVHTLELPEYSISSEKIKKLEQVNGTNIYTYCLTVNFKDGKTAPKTITLDHIATPPDVSAKFNNEQVEYLQKTLTGKEKCFIHFSEKLEHSAQFIDRLKLLVGEFDNEVKNIQKVSDETNQILKELKNVTATNRDEYIVRLKTFLNDNYQKEDVFLKIENLKKSLADVKNGNGMDFTSKIGSLQNSLMLEKHKLQQFYLEITHVLDEQKTLLSQERENKKPFLGPHLSLYHLENLLIQKFAGKTEELLYDADSKDEQLTANPNRSLWGTIRAAYPLTYFDGNGNYGEEKEKRSVKEKRAVSIIEAFKTRHRGQKDNNSIELLNAFELAEDICNLEELLTTINSNVYSKEMYIWLPRISKAYDKIKAKVLILLPEAIDVIQADQKIINTYYSSTPALDFLKVINDHKITPVFPRYDNPKDLKEKYLKDQLSRHQVFLDDYRQLFDSEVDILGSKSFTHAGLWKYFDAHSSFIQSAEFYINLQVRIGHLHKVIELCDNTIEPEKRYTAAYKMIMDEIRSEINVCEILSKENLKNADVEFAEATIKGFDKISELVVIGDLNIFNDIFAKLNVIKLRMQNASSFADYQDLQNDFSHIIADIQKPDVNQVLQEKALYAKLERYHALLMSMPTRFPAYETLIKQRDSVYKNIIQADSFRQFLKLESIYTLQAEMFAKSQAALSHERERIFPKKNLARGSHGDKTEKFISWISEVEADIANGNTALTEIENDKESINGIYYAEMSSFHYAEIEKNKFSFLEVETTVDESIKNLNSEIELVNMKTAEIKPGENNQNADPIPNISDLKEQLNKLQELQKNFYRVKAKSTEYLKKMDNLRRQQKVHYIKAFLLPNPFLYDYIEKYPYMLSGNIAEINFQLDVINHAVVKVQTDAELRNALSFLKLTEKEWAEFSKANAIVKDILAFSAQNSAELLNYAKDKHNFVITESQAERFFVHGSKILMGEKNIQEKYADAHSEILSQIKVILDQADDLATTTEYHFFAAFIAIMDGENLAPSLKGTIGKGRYDYLLKLVERLADRNVHLGKLADSSKAKADLAEEKARYKFIKELKNSRIKLILLNHPEIDLANSKIQSKFKKIDEALGFSDSALKGEKDTYVEHINTLATSADEGTVLTDDEKAMLSTITGNEKLTLIKEYERLSCLLEIDNVSCRTIMGTCCGLSLRDDTSADLISNAANDPKIKIKALNEVVQKNTVLTVPKAINKTKLSTPIFTDADVLSIKLSRMTELPVLIEKLKNEVQKADKIVGQLKIIALNTESYAKGFVADVEKLPVWKNNLEQSLTKDLSGYTPLTPDEVIFLEFFCGAKKHLNQADAAKVEELLDLLTSRRLALTSVEVTAHRAAVQAEKILSKKNLSSQLFPVLSTPKVLQTVQRAFNLQDEAIEKYTKKHAAKYDELLKKNLDLLPEPVRRDAIVSANQMDIALRSDIKNAVDLPVVIPRFISPVLDENAYVVKEKTAESLKPDAKRIAPTIAKGLSYVYHEETNTRVYDRDKSYVATFEQPIAKRGYSDNEKRLVEFEAYQFIKAGNTIADLDFNEYEESSFKRMNKKLCEKFAICLIAVNRVLNPGTELPVKINGELFKANGLRTSFKIREKMEYYRKTYQLYETEKNIPNHTKALTK